MAKKLASKKKASGRNPSHKKATKRGARHVAHVTVQQTTSEGDTIDLSTVDGGAVHSADSLAAVPVTPPAPEAVNLQVAEVAAALPEVEDQAQQQQGHLAELVAYREVLWLVGLARRPRSAIVGRALAQAGGVGETTPRTYEQVCTVIQRNGRHHLREEFRIPLEGYQHSAAANARTLSNLLGPAVTYLCELDLVRLGQRKGMYLVGRGPELFEGWPEWGRRDEEPAMPRRGGQHEQGPPTVGLVPPPQGQSPPEPPQSHRRTLTLSEDTGQTAPPSDRPQPTPVRILRLNEGNSTSPSG